MRRLPCRAWKPDLQQIAFTDYALRSTVSLSRLMSQHFANRLPLHPNLGYTPVRVIVAAFIKERPLMPSLLCGCSRCTSLAALPAPHRRQVDRRQAHRENDWARGAFCLLSAHPASVAPLPISKMTLQNINRATLSAKCGLFLALALVLLTACQPLTDAVPSNAATPVAVQTSNVAAAPPALATLSLSLPEVTQLAPLSDAEATVAALLPARVTPLHIAIAAAGIDVPVQPLAWERYSNGEGTSTRWVLPTDAAGWHPDSARPGETGTILLSGAQLDGGVFAPIALGDVQVGQTVQLLDSAGVEHRYQITDVTAPIALEGDPSASGRIAEIMAPTSSNRLLLITGWPDFTTTHRIFVVAEEIP